MKDMLLWELNIPYAIIQKYDDIQYNENISDIVVFKTKKAFKDYIKYLDEIQTHTGMRYIILFENKEKIHV